MCVSGMYVWVSEQASEYEHRTSECVLRANNSKTLADKPKETVANIFLIH